MDSTTEEVRPGRSSTQRRAESTRRQVSWPARRSRSRRGRRSRAGRMVLAAQGARRGRSHGGVPVAPYAARWALRRPDRGAGADRRVRLRRRPVVQPACAPCSRHLIVSIGDRAGLLHRRHRNWARFRPSVAPANRAGVHGAADRVVLRSPGDVLMDALGDIARLVEPNRLGQGRILRDPRVISGSVALIQGQRT